MLTTKSVDSLSIISVIALGFIAFAIGQEFKFSDLKKLGKKVLVITIFQSLFAVVFVIVGLGIYQIFAPGQINISMILILGAIATATAPAATLMVVRQYKAKGIVTSTLLPVVALDDAIGLILFSLCMGMAQVFSAGDISIGLSILKALGEIAASFGIGAILGFLLVLLTRWIKDKDIELVAVIFVVLAGVGICEFSIGLELSALLIWMMIGVIYANYGKNTSVVFGDLGTWTVPLYMLFFILSGAQLDLSVLPYVGVIGVLYVVLRSLGKYMGAYTGAAIVKSDKKVRNYLGLTLLPQGGVEIGMIEMVKEIPEFAGIASKIATVVLSAILVYELIGPVITKFALMKTGEIIIKKKSHQTTNDMNAELNMHVNDVNNAMNNEINGSDIEDETDEINEDTKTDDISTDEKNEDDPK